MPCAARHRDIRTALLRRPVESLGLLYLLGDRAQLCWIEQLLRQRENLGLLLLDMMLDILLEFVEPFGPAVALVIAVVEGHQCFFDVAMLLERFLDQILGFFVTL